MSLEPTGVGTAHRATGSFSYDWASACRICRCQSGHATHVSIGRRCRRRRKSVSSHMALLKRSKRLRPFCFKGSVPFASFIFSWCPRWDLNPHGCPYAPQTYASASSATRTNCFWCRRWDLNPHERYTHCALNAARLPVPPLRRRFLSYSD